VAISDEVEKADAGIVTGTTPREIAAGLEALLRDRGGLAAKSKAARALARDKFSIETMGMRLEALYRDILVLDEGRRVALAS
jgi:glycosyltransferase involved in cell wall biosynthesis